MQTMNPPTPIKKAADPYLAEFDRLQKGPGQPAWLFPVRKAAMARFVELGIPTVEHEDWRYTNVGPIVALPFKPAAVDAHPTLDPELLGKYQFKDLQGTCLVFINGRYSRAHSTLSNQRGGIQVTSLAEALAKESPLLQKYLPRFARAGQNAFATLNVGFFQDGAFIYVPAGQTAEPVHLIFVNTASEPGTTAQPRNLVVTEPNSKLTVVETYLSTVDAPYFTNTVSDFVIGDGSVVEHLKLQDESLRAFHLGTLSVNLGASVNFVSHSIALGAKLSRNTILTSLNGEGAECILNGLYVTREEQLADHWMRVEHVKPHCNSHEYFNGILEDRSRGVFHGRILVQPEAQKTDAKQTNKNLLLSDHATINTKPQLEIYADDVKCTHGATVGQLNQESIFYLRARGIGLDQARRILIHAFAGEILERIQCEPVRAVLDKRIWDRLEQNPSVAAGH